METIYSDITKDFKMNALTKDVGIALNAQAVKDSILGLLMTDQGERLYQPNVGGNIRALLFEHPNITSAYHLQKIIQQVITNHEPRCVLQDVVVDIKNNEYDIKVQFYVINNLKDPQTLTVKL